MCSPISCPSLLLDPAPLFWGQLYCYRSVFIHKFFIQDCFHFILILEWWISRCRIAAWPLLSFSTSKVILLFLLFVEKSSVCWSNYRPFIINFFSIWFLLRIFLCIQNFYIFTMICLCVSLFFIYPTQDLMYFPETLPLPKCRHT